MDSNFFRVGAILLGAVGLMITLVTGSDIVTYRHIERMAELGYEEEPVPGSSRSVWKRCTPLPPKAEPRYDFAPVQPVVPEDTIRDTATNIIKDIAPDIIMDAMTNVPPSLYDLVSVTQEQLNAWTNVRQRAACPRCGQELNWSEPLRRYVGAVTNRVWEAKCCATCSRPSRTGNFNDFRLSPGSGATRKQITRKTEMDILRIQSPWILTQGKLKALFGEDKGIRIECDDRTPAVTLFVESAEKADALARILPERYEFGNVKMPVTVTPANADTRTTFKSTGETLAAAFAGNPVVSQIRPVSKGFFRNLTYCVFRNEVVQFFADNLGDINGFCSTLMEGVARDLLRNVDDVFFCTSAGEKLQAPLGEWP